MSLRVADVTAGRLLKTVSEFQGTRVGVLGDFGADVFIYGRPGRLSREAPVPILEYEDRRIVPGMAGNVVRNLAALGASPVSAGVAGDDEAGRRIRERLKERACSTEHLFLAPDRPTCTKTRIMAGGAQRPKQQVVRLDRRPAGTSDGRSQQLRECIEGLVDELDALIISDYGNGTVTDELRESVGGWSVSTTVVVDSRYRLGSFFGATAATPNQGELEECVGEELDGEEEVVEAAAELRAEREMEALLVTRGNEGMVLCTRDADPVSVPIVGREDVTDVTGAGDTVVAAFAMACGAGADYADGACLATHAAGVVVTKPRTATCDVEELRNSVKHADKESVT